MSFSMSEAANGGSKQDREQQKVKLKPGTYEVTIVDAKAVNSPSYGAGFALEFVVDAGPGDVGAMKEFCVFPDAPPKAGSRMPRATAKAKDIGKIQTAVAAAYGLPATRRFEIDDAKYQASIARPVSPLRGRKITVISVPRLDSNGQPLMNEPGYYYEIEPAANAEPVTQVRPVAPKAPALPAKPATKPTLASVMATKGFEVHPDDADFVFNADTGEVIEVSEFKLTFGL